MTSPKFQITEGEHGPEYWDGETKVAFINAHSTLQSVRGQGDRKPEVEAFIEWHKAHDNPSAIADDGPGEPEPAEFTSEGEGFPVHETKLSAETISIAPVERPPTGSPELGDKDPDVIAWHFKNDPKAAKVKYASCKHLWPI
jgi:hypothetical protein